MVESMKRMGGAMKSKIRGKASVEEVNEDTSIMWSFVLLW
jgi:hypothetical protein